MNHFSIIIINCETNYVNPLSHIKTGCFLGLLCCLKEIHSMRIFAWALYYNWICLLHLRMESLASGVLLVCMTGCVFQFFATPFFNVQFAMYNWRKYSNVNFKGLIQDISSVYKSSGLTYKVFLLSAYSNCTGIPCM